MVPHHAAMLLAASFGAVVMGCAVDGDGGVTDPEDASPAWGYSGDSLCTEVRDPTGEWCDPEGKLGSLEALERARAKVADLPVISVTSFGDQLDPDGRELRWYFHFDVGEPDEVLELLVSGDSNEVPDPAVSPTSSFCRERVPIEAYDSQRLVPHAVLQFEEHTGRRFTGRLAMDFGACELRPESNMVRLRSAEPRELYFARYWGDGRFIELVGPCPADLGLDSCLEGGF